MIRDNRQPVEAYFQVVSDFRREIYDNSLAHPAALADLTSAPDGAISSPGTQGVTVDVLSVSRTTTEGGSSRLKEVATG